MAKSIQGLERGKFTPESNDDYAVVRTNISSGEIGEDAETLLRNNVRFQELLSNSESILKELEKINMYFALITNTKL